MRMMGGIGGIGGVGMGWGMKKGGREWWTREGHKGWMEGGLRKDGGRQRDRLGGTEEQLLAEELRDMGAD